MEDNTEAVTEIGDVAHDGRYPPPIFVFLCLQQLHKFSRYFPRYMTENKAAKSENMTILVLLSGVYAQKIAISCALSKIVRSKYGVASQSGYRTSDVGKTVLGFEN